MVYPHRKKMRLWDHHRRSGNKDQLTDTQFRESGNVNLAIAVSARASKIMIGRQNWTTSNSPSKISLSKLACLPSTTDGVPSSGTVDEDEVVMLSPSGFTAVISTFPLRIPASTSSWVMVTTCVQVKTCSAGQNERSPWKSRRRDVRGTSGVFAVIAPIFNCSRNKNGWLSYNERMRRFWGDDCVLGPTHKSWKTRAYGKPDNKLSGSLRKHESSTRSSPAMFAT